MTSEQNMPGSHFLLHRISNNKEAFTRNASHPTISIQPSACISPARRSAAFAAIGPAIS